MNTFLLWLARITLVALTAWVAVVAASIERQNAAAGNFLPRRERDRHWRVSRQNTTQDDLHAMVETIGCPQYVLGPLVVALACVLFVREQNAWMRGLAAVCTLIGFAVLWIAIYRGYLESLA